MLSGDYEWILCDEPECDNKIKNHKWGRIKAYGWFMSRMEKAHYCPDHIPDWLGTWRKKRDD